MNEGEIVASGFVVARGDAAALFDSGPETLGQVTTSVQPSIVSQAGFSALQRRNDDLSTQGFYMPANAIAVVTFVGDHGRGTMLGQQAAGVRGIRFLAGGQLQLDRQAPRVDRDMQLAAEAAAGTAERLLGLSAGRFFCAPAACAWARMIVESRTNASRSGSPVNVAAIRAHRPRFAQRLKRRNTLFHGPNRSGRSRHGAPVFAIQNTASKNNRLSAAFRPAAWPRPGRRPSINNHCSSVIA